MSNKLLRGLAILAITMTVGACDSATANNEEPLDGTFVVKVLRMPEICQLGVFAGSRQAIERGDYSALLYVHLGDSLSVDVYGATLGDELAIFQLGCAHEFVASSQVAPTVSFTVEREVSRSVAWSQPKLYFATAQHDTEYIYEFRVDSATLSGQSPYHQTLGSSAPIQGMFGYLGQYEVDHYLVARGSERTEPFRTTLASDVHLRHTGATAYGLTAGGSSGLLVEVTFRPHPVRRVSLAPAASRLSDETARQLSTMQGRHAYAIEMSRRRKH